MSEGNYLIKIFYDAGDTLSAPDASGNDAIFFIKALHILGQLNGQFAAGATERMTQRDSAAIDIDDVGIELQPADNSQRL